MALYYPFGRDAERRGLTSTAIASMNHEELEQAEAWLESVHDTPMSESDGRLYSELRAAVEARRVSLRSEAGISNLRDLIKTVPEDIRPELEKELDQLEETRKEAQKLSEDAYLRAEEARLSAEAFERRSRVWLTFLERESVATVVGSLLLVILTLSIIFAMFAGVESTDIVNNGFLVLLGYFFGQTVSKATSGSSS